MNFEKRDMNKLGDVVRRNYAVLRDYRGNRTEALRQYVGKHYGKGGTKDRVPLNLLELMVSIYSSHLIPSSPKASITSKFDQLRLSADNLELALNHLLGEIDFESTMSDVVVDSLFNMGVVKIGLNYSHSVEIGGVLHDVGQPFCDYIDFDDLSFDMSARRWEECTFIADKMVMTKEQLTNAGLFDEEGVKKLIRKGRKTDNENTASEIQNTRKITGDDDELYEFYTLWNIYLPLERKVVVMSDDLNILLRVADWEGPENGPYRILSYSAVPGNLMPLSPVSALMDLHDLTNVIYRQLGRQAQRQKTVMMAQGGAQKDAERVMTASDGDVVRVDDPNKLREVRFNGADSSNMGFAMQARNYFSYFAGNLDSLGGLGASADTARQEDLIAESSSFRMKQMSYQVKKFLGDVMRDLAWYLFTDPFIDLPLVKEVPELDVKVERRITPEDMEGDFLDYNIEISPFDSREPSPDEKSNEILQYINYLAPYAQIIQQQGLSIDFAELSNLMAKFKNINELRNVIKFDGFNLGQPIGQPPAKMQSAPQPNQEREYKHTYESKSSTGGMESQLAQMAMGQGMQDNQASAMLGA